MSTSLHALDYLSAEPDRYPARPVCVVFGDEWFLTGLVMHRLREAVFRDEADETPFTTFDGETAAWREIHDELETASLFGPARRLVLVESADKFITAHRERLEKYADSPNENSVLVMQAQSWPATTRLHKKLVTNGLVIECKTPMAGQQKKRVDEARVCKWTIDWAKQRHDFILSREAAALLVEMVGSEFGLLHQELSKLALFSEPGKPIKREMVAEVSGGWRMQTVWELIDAATDGNAGEAIRRLEELLRSGEAPQALLGSLAWSLRRFAKATRIVERYEKDRKKIDWRAILVEAGFYSYGDAVEKGQRQLMQIGRIRGGRLLDWLLETDLALKGSHSSPDRARLALETLLIRLAKETRPAAAR